MGPEATPPESKAIAVNIFGTKKDKSSAMAYPGKINHIMEIPVKTLIMESPIDTATPIDKPAPMALAEMAPEVISSTCFVSTNTAGSA